MSKKVLKIVATIALMSVMVITLVGLCACQKDEDSQPSGDIQVVPYYDHLYGQLRRIYVRDMYMNWNYEDRVEIEIVTSENELKEKFDITSTAYSEGYFNNKVIMLIRFEYASSDENIEFINFAIKDNKYYPIFETSSPLPNEGSTSDVQQNFYIIEMDNRILEYKFQEILVVNRRGIDTGSTKYKSITSVFS